MKKNILFIVAVCILLVLTGCTSLQSPEAEQMSGEGNTIPDTNAQFISVPVYSESVTEPNNTTLNDTDWVENTDILTTTDQSNMIPEETDIFDYDVHVGDSIFLIRKQYEDVMLFQRYSCCIWKAPKGYCIACNDELTDQVFAVVRFSDDLELLEADGIELIKPIAEAELEQWIGKTLDEFIAQYGQYHVDFGSGFFYPAYISEIGTVYWMNVQYDYESDIHHMITEFHSFSLKDL